MRVKQMKKANCDRKIEEGKGRIGNDIKQKSQQSYEVIYDGFLSFQAILQLEGVRKAQIPRPPHKRVIKELT